MAGIKESTVLDFYTNTSEFERIELNALISKHTNPGEEPPPERKKVYYIAQADTACIERPITAFLRVTPHITVFTETRGNITTYEQRCKILPPDEFITANFRDRMMGRVDKQTKRRVIILQTDHYIEIKTLPGFFGGTTHLTGGSQLIIEDTTYKKHANIKVGTSRDFYVDNRVMTRSAIAEMPQDKAKIDKRDIPGMKRELEGIQTELGFDYRMIMYVLGTLCAQYMSRGTVTVKHSYPASLNLGLDAHKLVSPGEVVFTPGCGFEDVEINTFCMILGLSGGSIVLLLNDRVTKDSKILTGYSLYEYICRLFRNIIFTSNMYGCGVEHLWAFMAGMHKILKVYSHSDEGGAIRSILSEPAYPQVCGILQQATYDVLGYRQNAFGKCIMDKRVLLDMLLFFPNAMVYADTGMPEYPEYIPTLLQRHSTDSHTLLSYTYFSCTFQNILQNMVRMLADTFKLSFTAYDTMGIYSLIVNKRKVDHHLTNAIITPYQWVDSKIINVYNFTHDKVETDLNYYSDVIMPFFPQNTSATSRVERKMTLLLEGEVVDIRMPRHVARNYAYAYILNPVYNRDDGLSELVVIKDGAVATKKYVYDNFLFSAGDPIIGANKWHIPNCTLPNYYEMLPMTDDINIKLCVARSRFYPHSRFYTDGNIETIHRMSRLYPVAKSISKVAVARHIDKHFSDIVSSIVECGFQSYEEPSVHITKITRHFGNMRLEEEGSTIPSVSSDLTAINVPLKAKDNKQSVQNKKLGKSITGKVTDDAFNNDGLVVKLDSLSADTQGAEMEKFTSDEESVDKEDAVDSNGDQRDSSGNSRVVSDKKDYTHAEQENIRILADSFKNMFQQGKKVVVDDAKQKEESHDNKNCADLNKNKTKSGEETVTNKKKNKNADSRKCDYYSIATSHNSDDSRLGAHNLISANQNTTVVEQDSGDVFSLPWCADSFSAARTEVQNMLITDNFYDDTIDLLMGVIYSNTTVPLNSKPTTRAWNNFDSRVKDAVMARNIHLLDSFSLYATDISRSSGKDIKLYRSLGIVQSKDKTGAEKYGIGAILVAIEDGVKPAITIVPVARPVDNRKPPDKASK